MQTSAFKPIRQDLLELMKKAGFTALSFGIERLDPGTLKRIKKPIRLEVAYHNISLSHKLGFLTTVNYMIGFSFDQEDLIEKENKYFKETFEKGADVVSANILMPMPGTEEYILHQEKVGKWYLNHALLENYRPWYRIVKNLAFDFRKINIYSFDDKLMSKIIHTKAYFRSQSIRQKSLPLYYAFQVVLLISHFSEFLCKHNLDKIEKFIFKPISNSTDQIRAFFYFYFSSLPSKDKVIPNKDAPGR